MSRLYTDEQLAEIAKPFEDHALAALKRGDISRVRELLVEMKNGNAGLDGLSGHTLARKAAKLRKDFGEDFALEALARIGAQLMRTWTQQYIQGDERGAIADLVTVFREQTGAKTSPLEEDDDKVVLQLSPCGSGGGLERRGLPQKHPEIYGGWSDGVSSYCQICKASQKALNDTVGSDVWTTEKGEGGACRMIFTKRESRAKQLFDECERKELT
jgi:hypothetical protein